MSLPVEFNAFDMRIDVERGRAQESDQRLAFAEQREVSFSVDVVGAVAENLRDDVRFGKDSDAVGDGCALFRVLRVWVSGGCAGSGFYYYFKACFGQRGNDDGDESDSALVRVIFFGDADDYQMLL